MNDQPHIPGARPWIDPDQIRRIMGDEPLHQPLFIGVRFTPEPPSPTRHRLQIGLAIIAAVVLVIASCS